MSKLIVEVCKVENKAAIDGADRIEQVLIKNWWCVAGKDQYKIGDKVVYVPPDAVIPKTLSDRWGITKFCSPIDEDKVRVRACRFKGVASAGTVQDLDDPNWEVGHDLIEHYGITKYEPPFLNVSGDEDTPVSDFCRYTDIENIGNFPNVLKEGEEVIVTEKIHGTNCRVGYVYTGEFQKHAEIWEWMAGSHNTRLKEFDSKGNRSMYWNPFDKDPTNCSLRNMIMDIWMDQFARNSIIVFGELYGPGSHQDMHYGQKNLSFRAFDICIDGYYMDYDKAAKFLNEANIPTVPLLYRGPFSMEKMNELVDGPTTVIDPSLINQPFKGREGIVIKPVNERFDNVLGGRAILKQISVDYHGRKNKNKTENH